MIKKLIIQIQIVLLLFSVTTIVTISANAQVVQPERVFTLPESSEITSYAISDDSTRIAVAFYDHNTEESKIVVMNAATGEQISTYSKHPYGIPDVTFSPDGNLVLSGGNEGIARLWDAETGVEKATVSTYSDLNYFPLGSPSVEAVAFSPDGQSFATVNDLYEPRLQAWDTQTQEKLYSVDALIQIVNGMEYTPDGKYIVTDSGGIISLEQKKVIKRLSGVGATISQDGDHVFIITGTGVAGEGVVQKWNIQSGELVTTSQPIPVRANYRTISKDGKLVLTSLEENELFQESAITRLIDVQKTTVLQRFVSNGMKLFHKPKFTLDQKGVLGFAGNKLFEWDISNLTASVPGSVKFE